MTFLDWLLLGFALVSGITTFIRVTVAGSQINPTLGIILGLICGVIVGILAYFYALFVLIMVVLAVAFGSASRD